MMGSEERGGTILRASFVLSKRKEQHMHRTHLVHCPARDNSPHNAEPQIFLLRSTRLGDSPYLIDGVSLVQRKSVPSTHMR